LGYSSGGRESFHPVFLVHFIPAAAIRRKRGTQSEAHKAPRLTERRNTGVRPYRRPESDHSRYRDIVKDLPDVVYELDQ